MKNMFRTQYANYIRDEKWKVEKFDLTPYLPLDNMDFSGLNLRCLDFEELELNNINFSNTDLNQVNLKECKITNCNFTRSNMTFTKLDNSIMINNIFDETLLRESGLINVKEYKDNTFTNNDVEIKEIMTYNGKRLALGSLIYVDRDIELNDEEIDAMFI